MWRRQQKHETKNLKTTLKLYQQQPIPTTLTTQEIYYIGSGDKSDI